MKWSEVVKTAPEFGGVYSVFAAGKLLYIGCSKNILKRLKSHNLAKTFAENGANEIRTRRIDNANYA